MTKSETPLRWSSVATPRRNPCQPFHTSFFAVNFGRTTRKILLGCIGGIPAASKDNSIGKPESLCFRKLIDGVYVVLNQRIATVRVLHWGNGRRLIGERLP